MIQEPIWVSENSALTIHSKQLKQHGGGDGVRDLGLLQSALARPQQVFAYNSNSDLCTLAAAYGYGLASNHPFVDGNKRTAYVCMRAFLHANGLVVSAPNDAKYVTMLDVAAGQIDEEALTDWLRENTITIE